MTKQISDKQLETVAGGIGLVVVVPGTAVRDQQPGPSIYDERDLV